MENIFQGKLITIYYYYKLQGVLVVKIRPLKCYHLIWKINVSNQKPVHHTCVK